jgi:DNA helicase-2/ATP-dependent DNA helicase PcrA
MNSLVQIRWKVSELLEIYQACAGEPAFSSATGSHAVLARISEECCKLTVIEDASLSGNVQGVLNRDEGTITFQAGLSSQCSAFIVAHEIGHFWLNHPSRPQDGGAADVIEDPESNFDDKPLGQALAAQDGVFRAYNERDIWELEANVFAAELLMPIRLLCERISADAEWSVDKFTAYFGVSKGAITNQLAAAVLSRPAEKNAALNSAARQPPAMDSQQETAASTPPPALVIAGPGAGKTRVLTKRFVDLVNRGCAPRRILALTFSNKAAAEMHERLCAVAGAQSHEIQVFTFHSFGLQLLMEYGTNIGLKPDLKILSSADAFVFLRTQLEKLTLGGYEDLVSPTKNIAPLLQAVSRAKDEMRSPEDMRLLAETYLTELADVPGPADGESTEDFEKERLEAELHLDMAKFYCDYQALLLEHGYVDYGDLITESVRLFDNEDVAEKIRDGYDHILVDEFQDINYASGRLVRALDGGRGIVWAVGDPKQSIYNFRGASRANIRDFAQDYPDATNPIKLDVNYRSYEEIVEAGQAVPFDEAAQGDWETVPKLSASRGRSAIPAVTFGLAPDPRTEMAAVLRVIREQRKHYEAEEIAVLCRSKSMARRVADMLEKNGVATNWSGQLEDRPPFRDLMGVLLLATDNPQGILRLSRHAEHFFCESDLRLLLKTARRKGNSALAALYEGTNGKIDGLSAQGIAQADHMRALVFTLKNLPNAWAVLAQYLFEEAQWPREFLVAQSPEHRRYLATTGQLADMAREFSLKGSLSGEADTAAFVDYVRTCLESGDFQCADSTDAISDAINVLTIHKSKGLEWPFVLVPNLNERAGNNRSPVRLPPGTTRDTSSQDDEFDELCIFYVALTRARDGLFLSRATKGTRNATKPLKPLERFLENLDPASVTRETLNDSTRDESYIDEPPYVPWQLPNPISLQALDAYDRCGQQFKYDYVYDLRDETRGYIQFRRAIYPVLQWIAERHASGESVSEDDIKNRLDEKWDEVGFSEGQFSAYYRKHANRIVTAFAGRMKKGVPVLVRQKCTILIDGIGIELTLDEIEEGDAPVIRIHHFGSPAKSHHDKNILALLPLINAEAQVYLTYPRAGSQTPCTFRKTFSKNRQAKAIELTQGMAKGEFKANPGDACPHCDYNLICPA